MYLTKSDFKVARSCSTKLYYKKQGYPSAGETNEFLKMLGEGGFLVEHMAKLLYPEGRKMEYSADPEGDFERTLEALRAPHVTLFEATLISRGMLARVDILQKCGDELHLVEVKATSFDSDANEVAIQEGRENLFHAKRNGTILTDWREYLEDVTFQYIVLKHLFPERKVRASLMMPDKAKINSIESLYSKFRLRRKENSNALPSRCEVEYLGDLEELRRNHILTRVAVDQEVAELQEEVRFNADKYLAGLNPKLRKLKTQISLHCKGCEYHSNEEGDSDGFRECWGALADVKPNLMELYQLGSIGSRENPLANALIQAGQTSLYDIPVSSLVKADGTVGEINRRQLLQIEHTRSNDEWISDELPEILEAFPYPLHFIDFETTTPAVPYHAGMRPYESVAFQWSCHTLEEPGAEPEHAEWIHNGDEFPNFQFAESLMERIGGRGTTFMWSPHENSILRKILEQAESRGINDRELIDWLREMTAEPGVRDGRLVDMNQLCLKHYFHPLMKGRTSIKVVCDAIWRSNPGLRKDFTEFEKTEDDEVLSPYASLPPVEIDGQPLVVSEGTAAIRAYEAMMYGMSTTPESRARWRDLLLQYCHLDTLSMVWIWRHWVKPV